jgi:hypothetical protein
MQFWYETLFAFETGGNNETITRTVNLPSTDVLVFCSLQQFNGNGGSPQAQMYINQYVANGDPSEGNWQTINANNVTSVSFTLTVNNARAQGLGLILAINE